MNPSILNDLRLLVSELFRYRTALTAVFVTISFSILGVGLVWPKMYESFVTIQVNENNIITPLMQGSAVTTSISDVSRNAKALLESRKVLHDVLQTLGQVSEDTSPEQTEKLIDKLKERMKVESVGQNLIKISYRNKDSELAMKGAQRFAELFLEDNKIKKSDESLAAFDFIDKQVQEYHAKLLEAERNLKEFRSEHLDARPGTEAQVSEQLNRLQRELERSELAYKEELIRYQSIERQLSGEAETTIGITRAGQIRNRIAELQGQLDTLRLSYTDTYPDIVQIRHQIEDLRNSLDRETNRSRTARRSGNNGGPQVDESVRLNPLYQQLRTSLSESKTNLATLQTRIEETKKLLAVEMDRGKKIHGGEAELSELTRDYEVNRDIYQDLLRRRENARVSKNLESGQNNRMTMYEPAFLPIKPTGIRFLHFMIAGLLLGALIPVGMFYLFQQVDPRIRSIGVIREDLGLPVLTVMPVMATPQDIKQKNRNVRNLGMALVLMVTLYFLIGLLRFNEII